MKIKNWILFGVAVVAIFVAIRIAGRMQTERLVKKSERERFGTNFYVTVNHRQPIETVRWSEVLSNDFASAKWLRAFIESIHGGTTNVVIGSNGSVVFQGTNGSYGIYPLATNIVTGVYHQ